MRMLDLLRSAMPLLLNDLVDTIDRDGVDRLAARIDVELAAALPSADLHKLAALARVLSVVLTSRSGMVT